MRRRQTPWPRGRRPTTVTPVWLLFACGSALFAGLTAILAKQGVRTTDSTLATALRTPVVLVGAWAMTVLSGSIRALGAVDARSLACLIASGLATGASWLCYFKALQLGDVSRVTPVDKMSTVLTALVDAFLGVALGLFVSAFARTEFQAVQFMPVVVGPQIFLCGLLVARDQMPRALELCSNVLPMSWAVDAVGELTANATPTADFALDMALLAAGGLVVLTVAALTVPRRTR